MPPNSSSLHTSSLSPAAQYLMNVRQGAIMSRRQGNDYEMANLRSHLKATLDKFEEVRTALEQANSQIERDAETISRLQSQVAELQELVQKQKATIAYQSKAIAEPKLRHKPAMYNFTPLQGYGLLSPPLNTPGTSRTPSSGVCERSPVFNGSAAPKLRHKLNFDATFLSPPSQLLYATYDYGKGNAEFTRRFQELCSKTEVFGRVHANVSDAQKDSQLERRVKDYVLEISDTTHASQLVCCIYTRFFLVAKMINFYLIRDVLRVTVIKGFDAKADREIGQVKKQMFPDIPASVRQLMDVTIANHVKTVRLKPGFGEFCQKRTREHMDRLWSLVGPLTRDSCTLAYNDLFSIISEAQLLAIDMYSVPMEYQFEFPLVNDPFDFTLMVNRDNHTKGDPLMLQKNGLKVKLGVTPIMRIRQYSAGVKDVKVAHMANVLLRAPAKGTHLH